MRTHARATGVIAAAVVLVLAVIGVQLANGGGRFEPLKPANPCAPRAVSSQSSGIDGLTERLVLLGIDGAACRLHVTRETYTLELAQSATPSDAQVDALHEGLLSAVRRMEAEGSLPPASDLVDEALDSADLNGFLKTAIRALPDSVINAALRTDDVLVRTIDGLDLRTVLANVDNPHALNDQVSAAVTKAVEDSLVARLRDLF